MYETFTLCVRVVQPAVAHKTLMNKKDKKRKKTKHNAVYSVRFFSVTCSLSGLFIMVVACGDEVIGDVRRGRGKKNMLQRLSIVAVFLTGKKHVFLDIIDEFLTALMRSLL